MYNYLLFFFEQRQPLFLLIITQKKWRYLLKYLRKNH